MNFLVCGISNALDGSQDDLMSSDIPNIEDEDEESEGPVVIDEEEYSSDVDGMGEPFSDVDPFSDDEQLCHHACGLWVDTRCTARDVVIKLNSVLLEVV